MGLSRVREKDNLKSILISNIMDTKNTSTEPLFKICFRVIKLLNSFLVKRYLTVDEINTLRCDCHYLITYDIPCKK